MTRVILHGCNGKMGQVITQLVKDDPEITIVGGIDVSDHIENEYPVYEEPRECDVKADVVIDFSVAAAVDKLMFYCTRCNLPLVLCSTGLNKEQEKRVEENAKHLAILYSANMSLGINLLLELLEKAAKVLAASGFDMEIVEKHHNKKLDAPSGTALALADALNKGIGGEYPYVYDRSKELKPRDKKEIGISSVRGGNIVGEHDVIFAGTDEVITFSHTAYSKGIFGKGAIEAAKFLAKKPAGFYTMRDVIDAR